MVEGKHVAGLYVCGWSKRGPSGTIGTNRGCGIETANAVISDHSESASADIADSDALLDRVAARVGRIVDFNDWAKIDAAEVARGARVGKPREKFTSIAQMLAAVAD
jgi:ferredoxin--NADP+ reductase